MNEIVQSQPGITRIVSTIEGANGNVIRALNPQCSAMLNNEDFKLMLEKQLYATDDVEKVMRFIHDLSEMNLRQSKNYNENGLDDEMEIAGVVPPRDIRMTSLKL